ncbi:MAG: C-terminal binding protein [Bifidobacteriaceae bacterium]|jgi:D-3-phosphoglycerate dehydrogenase|nr:C-terminal binding protein [Bifidobacteriaceae bacterium]
MSIPRVVYFNIDGGLDYENSLLRKWGHSGKLELVEAKASGGGPESFIEAAREADGAVVEYLSLDRAVLGALPSLRIVSVQSIGYNNIDTAAASEFGIAVTNAPGFCVQETALHTLGLLVDLARKITFLDRSVRAGSWNPLLGPLPRRLSGLTAGLVFFGGIPQRLAPALKAIGLRVMAWAPTKSAEFLGAFGVEKADTLDSLLEAADFVSLHTPLFDQTRHLISDRELGLMKPTAFLINTARGAVVDEPALVRALRSGAIAGAGIDVIEDEDSETSELFGLENVVITPHAAFVSEESFREAREICLRQQVQLLVENRRPDCVVNSFGESDGQGK